MKLRVVHSSVRLFRRLRSADSKLREAAIDAAAEALQDELQRAGANTISVQPLGPRRSVGSLDPSDAAREFGTQTQTPSPWLAPVLPLAREPMRAAAKTAAVRVFSILGKRKK
jgi:hypothetical protein